jgi:hypothetical protein
MGKVTIGAAEPFVNPVLLQVIVFAACFFSEALVALISMVVSCEEGK